MSKIKIVGHASGSGVLTIAAPNTNTDRTITIPDVTGTLLDSGSDLPAANLTGTIADARLAAMTASKLTGTIADARFPATLPALSAANLTAIPAANITGTLPAISGANLTGIEAGTKDFTADGALAGNGTTVILQANGTVKAVTLTSSSVSEDLTYSETYTGERGGSAHIAIDPFNANKILFAWYEEGTQDAFIKAGTISGSTITWGTSVEFNTITGGDMSIDFDPNTENSFICVYKSYVGSGSSNIRPAAFAGTLSGTAITLGTQINLSSTETNDNSNYHEVSFNPNRAGQAVAVWSNSDNNERGYAKVLSVSGTTVTNESGIVYDTAQCTQQELTWDKTADQLYIGYRGGSDYPKVLPLTINSSHALTAGTIHTVNSSSSWNGYGNLTACQTTAYKIIVFYATGSATNAVRVGNLSGSTITWGTAVAVDSVSGGAWIGGNEIECDVNTPNKVLMTWGREVGSDANRVVVGTLSGTNTITLGTHVIGKSGNAMTVISDLIRDPHNPGRFFSTFNHSTASPAESIFIVGHQVASNANATNLTTTNFIGTSTAAYADTATATIKLKGGVSSGHSSLTIGSDYYIQTNGTLGTSAATPSVKIGKAVSATEILMKGEG